MKTFARCSTERTTLAYSPAVAGFLKQEILFTREIGENQGLHPGTLRAAQDDGPHPQSVPGHGRRRHGAHDEADGGRRHGGHGRYGRHGWHGRRALRGLIENRRKAAIVNSNPVMCRRSNVQRGPL